MTTQEPDQLKRILVEAKALPAEERADFLETACAGDGAMRRELESLLEVDTGEVPELDVPLVSFAPAEPGPEPVPEGEKIGSYRIVRELGSGGLGTVYLASREKEYESQVAIKVVKRNVANADIVRRFRAERQILANLDHPNIARLLDGGTTRDGRPYLVMEYVVGLPLDEFCRQENLALQQRLELFRQICGAVQYAHRSLVVHRDLKPQNILVTAEGTPKLLDFGIAKLLSPEDSSQPAINTGVGERLLTPQYASPEQIRGEAITTASDVYSLGVVLYELLSGQLPYVVSSRQIEEAREVICDSKVEKPSSAVGTTGDSTSRGDSRRLSRRLAGDLDNIVLMALRKEPERRYSTVEQFSEDIGRHLRGLPVRARRDTLGYRASRFLRRNRIWVGVAALFFALVGIAGWAVFEQYQKTLQERDRAEYISTFMTELFRVADPATQAGEEVTARAILDTAAAELPNQLIEAPVLRADLMDKVGRVYLQLGISQPAQDLFEQALQIRLDNFRPDNPLLASSYHQLGRLFRETGNYDESIENLRLALPLQDSASRSGRLEAAAIENNLGLVLMRRGGYEEADPYLKSALEVRQKELGAEHELVGESLNNVASLHSRQERHQESLELNLQALAIRRKAVGSDHRVVAQSLMNTALDYQALGEFSLAEQHAREALQLRKRIHGLNHKEVARAQSNLGAMLLSEGYAASARDEFLRAQVIAEKVYEEDHPLVLAIRNNLAAAFRATGGYSEAEDLYREVLSGDLETFGKLHEYPIQTKHNLATTLFMAGHLDEAERFAIEAMHSWVALLGEDHAEVTYAQNTLAHIALSQGNVAQACKLFGTALKRRRELFGSDHTAVSTTLAGVAQCEIARGDYAEAEDAAREAVRIARENSPEGSGRVAARESVLGAALAAAGQSDDAERLLLSAVLVLEERLTSDSYYSKRARSLIRELKKRNLG